MSQLVELTLDESLALLRRRHVGRIAMSTPRGVRIYPVNYTVVQDRVVFRTVPYGEIAENAHGAQVAFEVDELDESMRSGWSVVAAGRCARVEDPDEVRMIRGDADPEPWADGQRILYFSIDWDDLTGRQLGLEGRPSLVD